MAEIIENLDLGSKPIIRGRIGLASYLAGSYEGENFTGKVFTNNNLQGVEFIDCDLSGADFSQNNNLIGVSFVNCNVAGATFKGTNVKPSQFIYAQNVEQANFDNTSKFLSGLEKERKKLTQSSNEHGIFYRFYRFIVRILGGNIKWYSAPPEGTNYEIEPKIDIRVIANLIPGAKVGDPKADKLLKRRRK